MSSNTKAKSTGRGLQHKRKFYLHTDPRPVVWRAHFLQTSAVGIDRLGQDGPPSLQPAENLWWIVLAKKENANVRNCQSLCINLQSHLRLRVSNKYIHLTMYVCRGATAVLWYKICLKRHDVAHIEFSELQRALFFKKTALAFKRLGCSAAWQTIVRVILFGVSVFQRRFRALIFLVERTRFRRHNHEAASGGQWAARQTEAIVTNPSSFEIHKRALNSCLSPAVGGMASEGTLYDRIKYSSQTSLLENSQTFTLTQNFTAFTITEYITTWHLAEGLLNFSLLPKVRVMHAWELSH